MSTILSRVSSALRPPERESFASAARRWGLTDADIEHQYIRCRRAARVAVLGLVVVVSAAVWSTLHLNPVCALVAWVLVCAQVGLIAQYVLQGWTLRNRCLWWERQALRRGRPALDVTPRAPAVRRSGPVSGPRAR